MRRPYRRGLFLVLCLLGLGLVIALAAGGLQWPAQPNDQLEKSWGGQGAAAGEFNEPTGIAVQNNEVFVADARNQRIQVFNLQGSPLRQFGADILKRPMNLSVANNRLYVADYFADEIFEFGLNGALLGRLAPSDGLNSPGGVDVLPDGSILVADTYKQRVVRFNRGGELLQVWGGLKQSGASQFNYPTDVAVLPGGGFVVADGYNDRIQIFDAAGNHRYNRGGPFAANISGGLPGWYRVASAVATNASGDILVADFFNGRFQRYDADGKLLALSENRDNDNLSRSVFAASFAADGSIWTSNFAEHRLERYGSDSSHRNN